MLSANGHVIDPRPRFPWTMPLQVLAMRPKGRLLDVSMRAGALFQPLHLGRGLAAGDLDVAAGSGAKFTEGSYIVTTVFRLGGVDTDEAERYARDEPEAFAALDRQVSHCGH